jgi:hypothetical protein
MNSIKRKSTINILTSLTMAIVVVTASLSGYATQRNRRAPGQTVASGGVNTGDKAPLPGNYSASTGQSAATASGEAVSTSTGQRGSFRKGGTTQGQGGGESNVQVNISRYTNSSELEAIAAAGQDQGFIQKVSEGDCGSVTINGQTFKANLATSAKVGSSYMVYIVSAKSFSTGRGGKGATVGFIHLTVDANGSGTGLLYTSTQVAVDKGGAVQARGGASTATQLSGVSRN